MTNAMVAVTRKIEYLASRNKLIYGISALYYRSIVENEVKLAGITPADQVLCIGGGPCPFTGILIHRLTGARVTIVDNIYNCVLCARHLIAGLGLDQHLKVIYADGKDIEVDCYSVIHLALQVAPFEEVFMELERKCRQGTRLLVRLPKKTARPFYSHEGGVFFSDCRYAVHGKSKNVAGTALYIKAGSNYEKSGSVYNVDNRTCYSHAAV